MTIDQLISLIRNPETHSKGCDILNTIIHDAFDMHLVTCPQCGQIHSFVPEDYTTTHTCTCKTEFLQDEAPDLFN